MPPEVSIPADEIAALLARPPEEFVAARTARVKELKAAGETPLAAALGTVRKPLRLVWVVGEIARREPEVAAAAAAVAEQLEEAQSGGGGVRPLLKRFRDAVAQVAARADDLDADRLEVGLALREVLADAEAREAWLGGHLLALPGDEDDASTPVAPAARPARRRARTTGPSGAADDDARVAEAEAAAAEAEARRAHEQAVAEAAAALSRAEAAQTDAEADRGEAADRVAQLEERLAELEAALAEARQELATRQAAVDDATAAVEEARTAHLDLT